MYDTRRGVSCRPQRRNNEKAGGLASKRAHLSSQEGASGKQRAEAVDCRELKVQSVDVSCFPISHTFVFSKYNPVTHFPEFNFIAAVSQGIEKITNPELTETLAFRHAVQFTT
jgi:hypothetical protein